jgi:hypothetical protein
VKSWIEVKVAHHQANGITWNHFVKRLQMDDVQTVELLITTRHSTANKKLSEGQQTEKESSGNKKLQIQNSQSLYIFAGSGIKPRDDMKNPPKRSCA